MEDKQYKKNCPSCGKDMFYSSLSSLSHCRNTKCSYCSNVIRGKSSNRKGCHHTEESKKKISNSSRGIKNSEIHKINMSKAGIKRYSNLEERKKTSESIKKAMKRPDVRKKHLDALHHSKWIKVRTDKGQLELLEKWNMLGFNFEPNYQIHTEQDLFYVDGYDKEKNVVLEYDSNYHCQFHQKQKDLVRQQKIIDFLKPKKFWRYDAVNKQFKNILGA
jgi:hypothetical protein